MTPRFLLLILSFVLVVQGHAQKPEQSTNHRVSVSKPREREYVPQTVVFKIKPEFKEAFFSQKEKFPAFEKLGKEVKLESIEQMFPDVAAPEKPFNNKGFPMVDLTLIHILKFSSNHSVNDVAGKISRTGVVVYAEPYYIDNVLFVPDDPFASPPHRQPLYFGNMQFYDALDIEDGDTNVVIGIIDTGVRWYHEDLQDNIKLNWADPIDGIDNDLDGYVDNFRGWDLGMGDNDPDAIGNEHGTMVAGCAAATMNNTLGLSGTAGKCKFMALKGSTDSPTSAINQGYPAIIYGANHGCKVINLSWGGSGGYSQTGQDIINYAAINKDVVLVAAAGNNNLDDPHYPASYEHVLSVGSVDTMTNVALDSIIEIKAGFSTYNYFVDVTAMGLRMITTGNDGAYTFPVGTSFSSPLVAGAAGLLRARYPTLTALQIAEKLRVTCDPLVDSVAGNITFKNEKLGKGRINLYRAMTDTELPAVRMIDKHLFNDFGEYAFSGDTVDVVCNFINYLKATDNATVTLSSPSPYITMVQDSYNLGVLDTFQTRENTTNPFVIYIQPNAPQDLLLTFRLGYSDPTRNYEDYQYFQVRINPTYLNIDTNQVTLTVGSSGKLGFIDAMSTVGEGLVYKGQNLIYESGLVIAKNTTTVSDCVRSFPAGWFDFDFSYIDFAKYAHLPEGDMGARAKITDTLSSSPIGLVVEQRTYAYKDAPNDKYIIVEYLITNVSGNTIDTLHTGIYNDWDIQNYNLNKANYESDQKLGYTYYTGSSPIYAGVSVLTNDPAAIYSMDHGSVGGNNINPNDGFSTSEKFNTLSKGVERPAAGGAGFGFDVSQMVGASIYNFAPNETRTVAFAFVVGDNLTDLKTTAQQARELFRINNTGAVPTVSTRHHCIGDTIDVTITPPNGSNFNFYTSPVTSTPAHTGSSYTISDVFQTDTIYISNIDSLFESNRSAELVIIHDELNADFNFAPSIIDLSVASHGYFVSTSQNAVNTHWDMGDGVQYSNQSSVMHSFGTSGDYKVLLTVRDVYNCEDTISKIVKVVGSPSTFFPYVVDGIKMYPIPATDELNIEFIWNTDHNVNVQIYNILGVTVHSFSEDNIMQKSYKIPTTHLKKGVYYARIDKGDKVVTFKFSIE